MVRDELSVMSAFLAVADEKSFTKAAQRLGVTQSHSVTRFEVWKSRSGSGSSRERRAALRRRRRERN